MRKGVLTTGAVSRIVVEEMESQAAQVLDAFPFGSTSIAAAESSSQAAAFAPRVRFWMAHASFSNITRLRGRRNTCNDESAEKRLNSSMRGYSPALYRKH